MRLLQKEKQPKRRTPPAQAAGLRALPLEPGLQIPRTLHLPISGGREVQALLNRRNSESGASRAGPRSELLAAELEGPGDPAAGGAVRLQGARHDDPRPGKPQRPPWRRQPGREGVRPADPPRAGRPERYLGHGFRRSCCSAHTRLRGKAQPRTPGPPGPQPQTPGCAAVRVQTLRRARPLADGHVTRQPSRHRRSPAPWAVLTDAISRGLRLRAAAAVSRGAESVVWRFSASRCGV